MVLAALVLAAAPVMAQSAGAGAALPPEFAAALAAARIPPESVSVLVRAVDGRAAPRLAFRPDAAMNPASVMKLVTGVVALDTLGPAFTWATPVYLEGSLAGGVLRGRVYIKGQGDPKLVLERLWLLLRRLRALGVNTIDGDLVLDQSAVELTAQDPGEFDGEPLRPYNAAPDALLLNFKAIQITFTPNRATGRAAISFEPSLAGVQMAADVPLLAGSCGDYRGQLRADFSDPERVRFGGGYAAACGERVWSVAYADPGSYAVRAVAGMWRELGGQIQNGQVREGRVPPGLTPAFELASPPLADVLRDINKFSNNVMAQQLFLTLSLRQQGVGSYAGSRDIAERWWRQHFREAEFPVPVLDNGSGLSRSGRITARSLEALLQWAWVAPVMPELLSSLPIAGVDGTLRRAQARAARGSAHLKTGSLRDSAAVAGYVHAQSGRRYVLVAMVNHPNAAAARPALDALLDWAIRD